MESMSVHDVPGRFEVIWANVECGISIIDAETREIIDINPVAARMFGGEKNDIIGKRCHKFICPAEEHSCPIMDKNQVVDRSERKFIKADGEVIPIIKSVAKVNYNGRLVLLESFTDISNLKKAEEQLRLMSIAEQANQAKSDFLSRMSHEMRTPLNAIIGMAKIAESTEDIEKLKYCLSTIENSSEHLLALINDILDMSKIEAGKFELHNADFAVEDMLVKICNITMELAEKKGLKLHVFLDKNACGQYIGDDLRLSQVITNLVSNAVKFTPSGGEIIVTARETERKEKDSVVQFSVTDSGIGMTEEQKNRLFKAFEQADTSISRRFGGTGLGLSISKNIVEKMGGNIWVESEPGKGSSFSFHVDLERFEPIGKRGPDYSALSGMKILVVSRDERLLEYFKSFTCGWGVATEIAYSAKDMIFMVNAAYEKKALYDMIFIDYNLPCDDIFEVVKQLHGQTDVGAIVLMTSFLTWNKIDAKTRGAGINRFIATPLLPSSIFNCLSRKSDSEPDDGMADGAADIPDFSGVTLLLAEDVDINREIFKALLENTGVSIDTAGNGLAAVNMFRENPDKYDIIIMDVHMPEMDGYEATRTIRAMDGRAREIPIIAMTANVFREDIEKCLASGMNDHLGKPIDDREVKRKILSYLRKRSQP